MRELLKEARGVIYRLSKTLASFCVYSEQAHQTIDRIDSALSAPDTDALEKVRKIRDAVIQEPCEGVQQIGFMLTDEAAAALIEPSVPRALSGDELRTIQNVIKILDAFEYTADEDSVSMSFFKARLNEDDFFYHLVQLKDIAAKHGVKVR